MFDSILGGIPTPLKFILAFALVIALILVAAWALRRITGNRIGGPAAGAGRSRQPRLGVLDVLNIDGRRRLVIVRRDNVEHLVMIGGPNDVVVESGILRTPAGAQGQRDAPPLVAPEPPAIRAAPPQPVPAPAPKVAPQRVVDAPPVAAPTLRAPAGTQPAAPSTPAPSLAPGQVRPPAPAGPQRAVTEARPAPSAPARPAVPQPAAPVPLRPAPPPTPAPQQQAPAVAKPAPAPQPIIAGPGARTADGSAAARSNELAERLAAALKRPVAPAARAPQPVASVDDLPREMPAMAPEPAAKPDVVKLVTPDAPAAPKETAPKAAAPEVRPETRAEPEATDDDEFSLEAEMANLLGRDVAKPKS